MMAATNCSFLQGRWLATSWGAKARSSCTRQQRPCQTWELQKLLAKGPALLTTCDSTTTCILVELRIATTKVRTTRETYQVTHHRWPSTQSHLLQKRATMSTKTRPLTGLPKTQWETATWSLKRWLIPTVTRSPTLIKWSKRRIKTTHSMQCKRRRRMPRNKLKLKRVTQYSLNLCAITQRQGAVAVNWGRRSLWSSSLRSVWYRWTRSKKRSPFSRRQSIALLQTCPSRRRNLNRKYRTSRSTISSLAKTMTREKTVSKRGRAAITRR